MYKRNCPICNKELTYTQKHNWKFAEENNTRCYHCRVVNRNGKNIECSWCKTLIYRRPSMLKKRKNHFCCNKCCCEYASKHLSGQNNKLWKGGHKKRREIYRKFVNNRRKENKQKAVNILGGKCQMCGYNKCVDAFDFHHINPKEKEINICKLLYKTWNIKLENELCKCQLLCANCHREHHSNEKLEA